MGENIKRSICLLLTFTLLGGDPAWAAGVSDLVRASYSRDLRDLSVPAKFGTVTDKWIAPHRSPFVVLIQDLHANISVQKNIAAIIEYLYHRVRVHSIFAEAAFATCDVSVLRSLRSRREQNKLDEKLLSKGRLTGDEMAAAHIGHGPLSPVKLEGVDDPLLYLANVQAFRDLVKVGPDAAREWKDLRDLLTPGATPQLRKHLELTEKLLALKLLDDEWLAYREHRNLTPRGSPALSSAIAAGERFYTAADARSSALTDNLLSKLGPSPAVLVTGGFHTATIAHHLKQHGIGFMVVTPQVERLDQEELYIQSMTEPPHETVRAIEGSAHAIAPIGRLMRLSHMSSMLAWLVGDETYQSKSFSHMHPEAVAAPWSWLDGLDTLKEFWAGVRSNFNALSQHTTVHHWLSLSVLYVGLTQAGSMFAGVAGMGAIAWLSTFAASVVIPLAALTLATRMVTKHLKDSWLGSKSSAAFQAYEKWTVRLKQRNGVAGWIAAIPLELAETMYGFAFVHANRLFEIAETGRLPEKPALTERWFHALPEWAQPYVLPFFATHRIISKRLLLKGMSTLGQVLLLGSIGTLLALLTPHHSATILSHILNFNLLGSHGFMGIQPHGSALGEAVYRFFSVFGMVSSYVVSLLITIGQRAWEKRASGLLPALRAAIQPVEIRDKQGKLIGTVPLWRGNFRGAFGMQTVGIEVAGLTSIGHLTSLSDSLIARIESQNGVLGAGDQFVRHVLGPLGIDPNQLVAHLPGTDGLTQEQLQALTQKPVDRFDARTMPVAPVRAAAAAGAGGSGGGDGGGPPEHAGFVAWVKNSFVGWTHPTAVLANNTPQAPAEIKSVAITAAPDGHLVWTAGDGKTFPARQGADFQPTEGGNHIYDSYIAPHRLPELYGQLLDPKEIEQLKQQDLFRGFDGVGRSQAEKLKAIGITTVRLYQAPVDDMREIQRFKEIMRLATGHGIHVYLSDMVGLYDHPNDPRWMHERVRRLAELYGAEPWLAAFGIGNENERYIRGGDGSVKLLLKADDYYKLMNDLAGAMHAEMKARGTSRPIFLGHAFPHAEKAVDDAFAQLSNFDGIAFNLYTSPEGLHAVLNRVRAVNARRAAPLRVIVSEFGQRTKDLPNMSAQDRASDFARQVEVLKQYPDLVASWFYFEATHELWKVQEEGPGADLHGIMDEPAIRDVTIKNREGGSASKAPAIVAPLPLKTTKPEVAPPQAVAPSIKTPKPAVPEGPPPPVRTPVQLFAQERLEDAQARVLPDVQRAENNLNELLATRTALLRDREKVLGERQAREASLLQANTPRSPEEVRIPEVLSKIQVLGPSRFASAAQELRTQATFVVPEARMADVENFTAAWLHVQTHLKSLEAQEIKSLSPEEAARLIQEINATLETVSHRTSVLEDLLAAKGLLSVRRTLSAEMQDVLDSAIHALQGDELANALDALQNLNNSLVDLTTWDSQQVVLNARLASLEKSQQELALQIDRLKAEEALAISHEGRALIAETLQDGIGPTPLEELAKQGHRALAGVPQEKRWTPALERAVAELDAFAAARKSLLDDGISATAQLDNLRHALLLVSDLQVELPLLQNVFDVGRNPNFKSDVAGLANAKDVEAFVETLTHGVDINRLEGLLQPAITLTEQQTSIAIQAQRQLAGASKQDSLSHILQNEVERLAYEKNLLESKHKESLKQTQLAKALAPNVKLAPAMDSATSEKYRSIVKNFHISDVRFNESSDQQIRAKVKAINASLVALKKASEVDNPKELTEAVFGVLDHYPDLANPAYIKMDKENLRQLADIQNLISVTAEFAIEFEGGLAEARLKDGVTDKATLEDQSVALLGYVAQMARLSASQEAMAHQLERDTGAYGWALNTLQAINIAYGLKSLPSNFNTLRGTNRYAFEVRTGPPVPNPTGGVIFVHFKTVAEVKALDAPSAFLASANLAVNAKGTFDNTQMLLTGKDPTAAVIYYATVLDPKIFTQNLHWNMFQKDAVDRTLQSNHLYFMFPDGKRLEAQKTLSKAALDADKDHWQEVSDHYPITGHYVAVADGKRYVWVSGKTPWDTAERLRAAKGALNGAILAEQILSGFVSGDAFKNHLVDVPANFITRYAAGMQVTGVAKGIFKFVDAMRYQKIVHSPNGAWSSGQQPKFVGYFQDQAKNVRGRIDSHGRIFYERTDETGALCLDDENGTVEYRYKTSGLRRVLDAVFDLHFHSVRYFQVSKSLAQKMVKSPGGFYVTERRPFSAPITPAAGDDHHVQTLVAGVMKTYDLGDVVPIQNGQETFYVRPYYLPSTNPDMPRTYLGLIRTNKEGALDMSAYGRTGQKQINPKTIYSLVTTLAQEMEAFGNIVEQGGWNAVDDWQAQVIRHLDGWPAEGWLPAEGGVEVYIPPAETQPTFMRWVKDGKTYTIDQRDPLHKMVYRETYDKGRMFLEQKQSSLQDYAKSAALAEERGDWFVSERDAREPEPNVQRLPVSGRSNAYIWRTDDGTWHMTLRKENGKFEERVYQTGAAGYDQALAALDAPFIRHQPLPEDVDLEALVRAGRGTHVQTVGPRGQEDWYFVSPAGGYVRYQEGGKARTDYLSLSRSGAEYQSAMTSKAAQDKTFLSLRLIPPQSPKEWVPAGGLPKLVKDILRDRPTEAMYAYDAASAGIYLRVRLFPGTAQESEVYFQVETTAAGKQAIVASLSHNGGHAPLGTDLPDELIETLPGYAVGAYVKENGQWYYGFGTAKGVELELSPHWQLLRAPPRQVLGQRSPVMGHLPATLGEGADHIQGHWYKRQIQEGKHLMPVWSYFEVGPAGGSYTDPDTHARIDLPSGSVWVVHHSILESKANIELHRGKAGVWLAAEVDPETVKDDAHLKEPDVHERGYQPYKIPGTSIEGDILISQSPNPYAPTVLVVTKGGVLNGQAVVPGQALVYELPLALLEKIGLPKAGDMALVSDPSTGRVESIRVDTINDPKLSGIKLVGELPDKGAHLPFPFTLKTPVQVDSEGHVKGIINFTESGLKSLITMQAGEGYIQMDAGSHNITLRQPNALGRPSGKVVQKTLAGWVRIGDAQGQISLPTLSANMRPMDGENLSRGALLMDFSNPKHPQKVGKVIFGVRAPPGDPNLTGDKIAAVYFLDAHGKPDWDRDPDYLNQQQLDARVPQLSWVARVNGKWSPVTYINDRWYALIRTASSPDLKADRQPLRKQPAFTPENAPLGELSDNGEVIGVLGFAAGYKPTNAAPASFLKGEELAQQLAAQKFLLEHSVKEFQDTHQGKMGEIPYPEYLRKVTADSEGTPQVTRRLKDGRTRVTFENYNHDRTEDTYLGSRLLSRAYFSPAETLESVIYFGPRGEPEPLFRRDAKGLVDEVYIPQTADAPDHVATQTISLSPVAKLTFDANASAETEYARLVLAAQKAIASLQARSKVTIRDASGRPLSEKDDQGRERYFLRGIPSFHLVNLRSQEKGKYGLDQVVGDRWWVPKESRTHGMALLHMNLGQTYGPALPRFAAHMLAPQDISAFDHVTFWVKGNEGGEKFHITFSVKGDDLDRPPVSWAPASTFHVTREWQRVSIPVEELQQGGVDVTKLAQIGVSFGNNVGNKPGAELFIGNFTFENHNRALPLEALRGDMWVDGDGQQDFFTLQTIPGSWSAIQPEASFLINRTLARIMNGKVSPEEKESGVVASTEIVGTDPEGNPITRVYSRVGNINYYEVRRHGRLSYRIYLSAGFNEALNRLTVWKERVYYNDAGQPLYSLDEASGTLLWVFQSRTLDDGSFLLWKRNPDGSRTILEHFSKDGALLWSKEGWRTKIYDVTGAQKQSFSSTPNHDFLGQAWRTVSRDALEPPANLQNPPGQFPTVTSGPHVPLLDQLGGKETVTTFAAAEKGTLPAGDRYPDIHSTWVTNLLEWMGQTRHLQWLFSLFCGIVIVLAATYQKLRPRIGGERVLVREAPITKDLIEHYIQQLRISPDEPLNSADLGVGTYRTLIDTILHEDDHRKAMPPELVGTESFGSFKLDPDHPDHWMRTEMPNVVHPYQLMPLRRYVWSRVIQIRLKEMANNSALVNWLVDRVEVLYKQGKAADIPPMVDAYAAFWYQIILKDQYKKIDRFMELQKFKEGQVSKYDKDGLAPLRRDKAFKMEDFYELYLHTNEFGQTGNTAVDSLSDIQAAQDRYKANPTAFVAGLLRFVKSQRPNLAVRIGIHIRSAFNPRGLRGLIFYLSIVGLTITWNLFLLRTWLNGILPYGSLASPLMQFFTGQIAMPPAEVMLNGVKGVVFTVAAGLPVFYFLLLSFMSIGYLGQALATWAKSSRYLPGGNAIQRVRTLKDIGNMGLWLAEKYPNKTEQASLVTEFKDIVADMRYHWQISKDEFERLVAASSLEDMSTQLKRLLADGGLRVEDAQERLKNWGNALLRKDPQPAWERPTATATRQERDRLWKQVYSRWIRLIWKGDPFYYIWDQFTDPNKKVHFSTKGTDEESVGAGRSILYQWKLGRPVEYENLIKDLTDRQWISAQEAEALRNLAPDMELPKFHDRAEQVRTINPLTGLEEMQPAWQAAIWEVEKWVNHRMQTVFHTLEGAGEIRMAYDHMARQFYPEGTDGLHGKAYEAFIEQRVKEKFQLLIATPFQNESDLRKKPSDLGKTAPNKDIARALEYIRAHERMGVQFVLAPTPSLVQSKTGSYKGQLLGYLLSLVWADLSFYMDADTEVRMEDARKVIDRGRRFADHPELGMVQYSQYIFNWPYMLSTRVIRWPIGAFWHKTLLAKQMFDIVNGFGHNLDVRTTYLRQYYGAQGDEVSEDWMIGLTFEANGIVTEHDDSVHLGEGNETTISQYGGTTTKKWASGIAEIIRSRVYKVWFMLSPRVPLATKIGAYFNTLFYRLSQRYTPRSIRSYIIGHLFLGIAAYSVLPPQYGFLGIMLSIGINGLMLVHIAGSKGWLRTIGEFLEFVLYGDRGAYQKPTTRLGNLLRWIPTFAGFFYWTGISMPQSEGVQKGMRHSSAYTTSRKGDGLWTESNKDIYNSFGTGIRLGWALVPFLILAPWDLYSFFAYLPYTMFVISMLASPYFFNQTKTTFRERIIGVFSGLWYAVTDTPARVSRFIKIREPWTKWIMPSLLTASAIFVFYLTHLYHLQGPVQPHLIQNIAQTVKTTTPSAPHSLISVFLPIVLLIDFARRILWPGGQTSSRGEGHGGEKSLRTVFLAGLGTLLYTAFGTVLGQYFHSGIFLVLAWGWGIVSSIIFVVQAVIIQRHGRRTANYLVGRKHRDEIYVDPELSPFMQKWTWWHEKFVHAVYEHDAVDILLAPIMEPFALIMAFLGAARERNALEMLETPYFGRLAPPSRGAKAAIVSAVIALVPHVQTASELCAKYFHTIQSNAFLTPIPPEANLYVQLDQKAQDDYFQAIKEQLAAVRAKDITPEFLFAAAQNALAGRQSSYQGKIGLQVARMNPPTYWHISQSLAGILEARLNGVLVVNGGADPGSPYATSARTRTVMTERAVEPFSPWLRASGVRGQIEKMFQEHDITLAGKTPEEQRRNLDSAAMVWLFVANPKVQWVYLSEVGDVKAFGKRNEQSFVQGTLWASTKTYPPIGGAEKILYSPRNENGNPLEVDPSKDIAPYGWLQSLWDTGFIAPATYKVADGVDAVAIRAELGEAGSNAVNNSLLQLVPGRVVNYVRDNPEVWTTYRLEINEQAAEKSSRNAEPWDALAKIDESFYLINQLRAHEQISASEESVYAEIGRRLGNQKEQAVRSCQILTVNAETIEAEAFILEVNAALELFGMPAMPADDFALARAMAYEIQRRLIFRENVLPFLDGEKKSTDRYNRVVEGVVQILTRGQYDEIVENPWIFDPAKLKPGMERLADKFARLFFIHLLKGVQEATAGHPPLAPPEAQNALERVQHVRSLDKLSTTELAALTEGLIETHVAEQIPGLQSKFMVYSAAPGSGKGEIMDATFQEGLSPPAPYAKLIGKLLLYHSRAPRIKGGKSEKDGVAYHFRESSHLKKLETNYEVNLALVNRQPQGLAGPNFVEPDVKVDHVHSADLLNIGDVVQKGGAHGLVVDRNGRTINLPGVMIPADRPGYFKEGDQITSIKGSHVTVGRSITGMTSIFDGNKPVILEGGYGWFKKLKEKYPRIMSVFIAPFTETEIAARKRSMEWIQANFDTAAKRMLAHSAMIQYARTVGKEIDLSSDSNAQWAVKQLVASQNGWLETVMAADGRSYAPEPGKYLPDSNFNISLVSGVRDVTGGDSDFSEEFARKLQNIGEELKLVCPAIDIMPVGRMHVTLLVPYYNKPPEFFQQSFLTEREQRERTLQTIVDTVKKSPPLKIHFRGLNVRKDGQVRLEGYVIDDTILKQRTQLGDRAQNPDRRNRSVLHITIGRLKSSVSPVEFKRLVDWVGSHRLLDVGTVTVNRPILEAISDPEGRDRHSGAQPLLEPYNNAMRAKQRFAKTILWSRNMFSLEIFSAATLMDTLFDVFRVHSLWGVGLLLAVIAGGVLAFIRRHALMTLFGQGKKESNQVPLVDENDVPTGEIVTRQEAHVKGLRHRAVGVLLVAPDGSLPLTVRGPNKDIFPSRWTLSASGHVDPGMSYEQAAVEETQQELGLSIDPDRLIPVGPSWAMDNYVKQYLFHFKVNTGQVVAEHTLREIQEQLYHEFGLKEQPGIRDIVWKDFVNPDTDEIFVEIHTFFPAQAERLRQLRDRVRSLIMEQILGPKNAAALEEKTILNRDKRKLYLYPLTSAEEARVHKKELQLARTNKVGEVKKIEFMSLADMRQRFNERLSNFTDDSLFLGLPLLSQEIERKIDALSHPKIPQARATAEAA